MKRMKRSTRLKWMMVKVHARQAAAAAAAKVPAGVLEVMLEVMMKVMSHEVKRGPPDDVVSCPS